MNCTIIAPIAPSQRFKFIFRHLMIGLFQDLNNETPTRGIKHWGLGGYSNLLPRIKFGVTGQESSPQSPTISYRHPLAEMVEIRAERCKSLVDCPLKLSHRSIFLIENLLHEKKIWFMDSLPLTYKYFFGWNYDIAPWIVGWKNLE